MTQSPVGGLEPVNPELGVWREAETEALVQQFEELVGALDVDLFDGIAVMAVRVLLGCERVAGSIG